jgi:cytochrome c5
MSARISPLVFGLAFCALLAASGAVVVAQDSSSSLSVAASSEAPPADDATADVPTPEEIIAGKRIWVDAACFNCHGTNGQGGSSKDFPHGPSLRTSQLDRATMLEVTACGLPGTLMPGWAKGAYVERPCFGDETGTVPEGTRVIGAYDEAQLESLMDYIEGTFRKNRQQ